MKGKKFLVFISFFIILLGILDLIMEFDHRSYIIILVGLASLFASLNISISRLAIAVCIAAAVFIEAIHVSNLHYRVILYAIGSLPLIISVGSYLKGSEKGRGMR
ncbi:MULTISPECIES: hypothetical protein [Archaeoglobus]|jgi:predicted membrane protein|nr:MULTISPECIES: hypothetical protein [Archaeoglobus]AIG96936.1 hypothetical protein AFULGI_00000950 [Archaeoglobus fulgidus DSM 8774]KUJ94640.1 MAG: hypothetical protein XD40_0204 [Archaeoglobus fulgidus]KUK05793.1 MAG: Uncharacterized protein XD48_1979 [Archaeoglobus fulgidus]MDI3498779.1 hypothetical protein [Archaeoglobus sp.]